MPVDVVDNFLNFRYIDKDAERNNVLNFSVHFISLHPRC
jgi:hypothetical protein